MPPPVAPASPSAVPSASDSWVVSADDARAALARVLVALAGPTAVPKPDQLEAVVALTVERRRTLVVQATGWGKSAVYLAAASAIRAAGGGPVLVVSPLLALMRDQVDAANRAGLRAVSINSANVDDWPSLEAALLADEVDLLLVSPERLASPRFGEQVLQVLLAPAGSPGRVGAICLDEIHCLSDWGFDFRPDYRRLGALIAAHADLPVLGTTATANGRVTDDVAAQLGTDTVVLRGPLARESLTLAVVPGLGPLERYAWVADALRTLPGSGIVYTLTVAEAERLAAFLTQELAGEGLAVASYTGQLDPADRATVEDQLRANELKAVVATSALGMGYDKPDLAFCLHVGSPSSPVAYYQQVGRAGRAVPDAVAILLPAESDARVWEYFATASVPTEANASAVLRALSAAEGPLSVITLEADTGIRRGRLETLLKVLAVDGATNRVGGGWVATGARWSFDAPKYASLVAMRRSEADLMASYARGAGCLMGFLREALDDLSFGPGQRCGRCSVCTGALPAGLPETPSPPAVEAARAFTRGVDVRLEPRKMWPSGLDDQRGRIPAALMAGEGRALAFADDPGWAREVLALVGDGAPGREVDDEVLAGLVAVLARWAPQWAERPVAVVPVPSRSRPRLVASLAARIAEVGRLPVADVLVCSGPAPSHGLTSSARAAAVAASLSLRPGAVVPAGPVLLVDDAVVSGWTITVAAALLGDAGAGPALPLVLHRRP